MSTSTSSSCDRPAVVAAAPSAVEFTGVGLRFRRYADYRSTFKQTVLNTLFRRRFAAGEDFWAIRGLNLKIEQGQRLGVIGPNAAGKSTLLKLLAGIYRPSEGCIRIRGQVVPLIELGAGFNPELSGVDNIYLKGALLGYCPSEMEGKVESILEFAGLRDFAGTPIKYYSTGMLLRLAFSVATDVEPEILLVDEIFAAGDAEFVTKAASRMERLMDDSHIVVLVSHELALVRQMCDRVIWLDHGRIIMDGEPRAVCEAYAATAD